jgi:dipeptidyl aminopeptidase/acylaminoacyl peptidase
MDRNPTPTPIPASATLDRPASIALDGMAPVPRAILESIVPYLGVRPAHFVGWHPRSGEMLIATRFTGTLQLFALAAPGAAPRQLTDFKDLVKVAAWAPGQGELGQGELGQGELGLDDALVFERDAGGDEFYQLYCHDPRSGAVTLATDGQSRNTPFKWRGDGALAAYSSTRRNGADTDIYVVDPRRPETDRLLLQVSGGGWTPGGWSPDGRTLAVRNYISAEESHLHLCDLATGALTPVPGANGSHVFRSLPVFDPTGRALYFTSNHAGEFDPLYRLDLMSGQMTALTADIPWSVEEFDLSPDGALIAATTNEAGFSVLRVIETATGRARGLPAVPKGVIAHPIFSADGRRLGFDLTSARLPSAVYAIDLARNRLVAWMKPDDASLDTGRLVEPETVRIRSFDGLEIHGFLYRPDPTRFPGRRPAIVDIHGGPEMQLRPIFRDRANYHLEELGIALFYPNVRGSSGYGKTYVGLDNERKREDSVRDIGAVIDWLARDPGIDGARIGVTGNSYGGYMTLATLVHFGPRVRAAIEGYGISSWITMLRDTQAYRQDLRRVEYGDERDPAMAAFLESISPLTHVHKIRRPLLVLGGANDPRVPLSESGQIVRAVRQNGGEAWYLVADNEGHGFTKKANIDYVFGATVMFWRKFLLG